MAREKKSRKSDAKLARLHVMSNQPATSGTTLELRRYLADASSFIVAEAAKIIKDHAVPELVHDLVAAFDRLMIDPEESDKQCRAKIEIVDALNRLEYAEPDVFLRGLTHRQDPRFGEPGQDAAGALRAHCAFGLARINPPGVVLLLTELLLDSDDTARGGRPALSAQRDRSPRFRFCVTRCGPAIGWTTSSASVLLHCWPCHSRHRCRSWPGICRLRGALCKEPPCSPWPRRAGRKGSPS